MLRIELLEVRIIQLKLKLKPYRKIQQIHYETSIIYYLCLKIFPIPWNFTVPHISRHKDCKLRNKLMCSIISYSVICIIFYESSELKVIQFTFRTLPSQRTEKVINRIRNKFHQLDIRMLDWKVLFCYFSGWNNLFHFEKISTSWNFRGKTKIKT